MVAWLTKVGGDRGRWKGERKRIRENEGRALEITKMKKNYRNGIIRL